MKSKDTSIVFLFSLGLICIFWIIFNFISLNVNLHDVLFMGPLGVIAGFGYLLIILFHILVGIYVLRKQKEERIKKIKFLFICSVSFLFILIQKVMYDEVANELAIEKIPAELNFIFLGLIVNALFIGLVLKGLYNRTDSRTASRVQL